MDDDILSQGEDREPRRWPRGPWVIAAVVLAVIAGVGYLVVPRDHHAASAAPPATPSATALAAIPDPGHGSGNVVLPGQPPERQGIILHGLPWSDSLRLPVAGTQPAWFWPATGRSERIGGLPADSAGLSVHPRRRRLGGAG